MKDFNKITAYRSALEQIEQVIGPNGYQIDLIGKMSIVCAILKLHFPNWVFVGFYRHTKPSLLEIGPYQGNIIACGTISFDRGVCGAAAREKTVKIVADVQQFPGYILCDDLTRSEIVIPVMKNNKLIAVLDIDSAELAEFDQIDQVHLETVIKILSD